jgi:hypothetical protein
VAQEIDLLEAQVRAQRIEVVDLFREATGLPSFSSDERPFPRWS